MTAKYRHLILILLFFGCSERPKRFPIPKVDDMNEIMKTIIVSDSLPKVKYKFAVDMRKLKIYTPAENDIPPPIGHYATRISNLLGSGFFGQADSLYILFQNNIFKQVEFGSDVIPYTLQTSRTEQGSQIKLGLPALHYDLTVPIFSRDQNTAYVEVNKHCPSCGEGWAVFLKRKGKEWEIVKRYETWTN